eukprot:1157644-Pelagomonas_calceolata.AAC.2
MMFTTGLRSGGATCSAGVHGNGTAQAVCGRRHRRESVLPMQTRQPASSQVLRHVLLPPPAQQATVAMRAAADSDQPNNNTFSPADLHNPDDGWTQTSELVQGGMKLAVHACTCPLGAVLTQLLLSVSSGHLN